MSKDAATFKAWHRRKLATSEGSEGAPEDSAREDSAREDSAREDSPQGDSAQGDSAREETVGEEAATADGAGVSATPSSTAGGPNLQPDPSPPDGRPFPLLDLRPGDRVHLPLATGGAGPLRWSEPVTITGVLLIDSGLVEVRWEPGAGGDPWAAHLLLMGPAYTAGAIRAR